MPDGCSNCGGGPHLMADGLCTVCYLAVQGTAITGMSREEALAMMRRIRADKRAAPMVDTMQRVADDMLGGSSHA